MRLGRDNPIAPSLSLVIACQGKRIVFLVMIQYIVCFSIKFYHDIISRFLLLQDQTRSRFSHAFPSFFLFPRWNTSLHSTAAITVNFWSCHRSLCRQECRKDEAVCHLVSVDCFGDADGRSEALLRKDVNRIDWIHSSRSLDDRNRHVKEEVVLPYIHSKGDHRGSPDWAAFEIASRRIRLRSRCLGSSETRCPRSTHKRLQGNSHCWLSK